MNIKALITTALILGTSTVALAGPRYAAPTVRDHRAQARLDVRFGFNTRPIDHRLSTRPILISNTAPAPSAYDRWGMTTVASFNYAFDGVQMIDLGWRGAYATKLRITSSDPNSEVYSVVVHFANGRSETYLWNHIFGSASDGQLGPHLDMGLPNTGSAIRSIEVSAKSNARLAVQLQG